MDLNAIPEGTTDCAREVFPMIEMCPTKPTLLFAAIHAVLHAEMHELPQALVIADLFGRNPCFIPMLVIGKLLASALFHSEM